MRIAPRNAAKIGIIIQFAALIRTLGEYFRLKYALGPRFTLAQAEPLVLGGLVAAVCTLVAVSFYFGEKFRLAVVASVITVVILLVLKFALY